MKGKPYPKYKPSRIEWLGEIPQHWNVLVLKRIFIVVNGATPSSAESTYWDGDISWATPDDLGKLKSVTIDETKRNITAEGYKNCGTSLAPTGSIILSTRAPIGHLAISGRIMCTNQGCRSLVYRKENNDKYYFYLVYSLKAILDMLGQGTTFKELSKSKLENVHLLVPSDSEKREISEFLDHETARIDSLIAKKERQIELLHEKRAALISHAVTKGLDPTAPMKDSGIEWIGEIPEHWDIKRLKYSFKLLTEKNDSHENQIALENIESWTGKYVVTSSEFEGDGISCRKNDILFGKLRPYLAKVYVVEESCTAVGDFFVMRPAESCYSRYASFFMLTKNFINIVDGSTYGAKMPRANWDFVSNLMFPDLPLTEQKRISEFLDRQTSKIDSLISKIQLSIDKLSEYRTSLISAAVTGKIDVRDFQNQEAN